MNKYFSYENIDLWQDDKWGDKLSSIYHLIQWIGNNEIVRDIGYTVPDGDPTQLTCYRFKNRSVELPEVVEYWHSRGVRYRSYGLGGVWWISMVPEKAFDDPEKKIPVLLVMHRDDYRDSYWAMRTMEYYRQYNEMAAEGNIMIVYAVTDRGPDVLFKYVSIMMEALCLNPGDVNNVYLDVSAVVDNGASLKNIPNFTYVDKEKKPYEDPDAEVFRLGNIPVIDISDRWQNMTSFMRTYIMEPNPLHKFVDRQRIIHSLYGKRMMDGIKIEYFYDTAEDSEIYDFWEKMGAHYESHYYKSMRYVTMTPKCAFDDGANELPLMVVMYEVNHTNDHFILSAYSSYHEYCKLAAQGDMMVLFFTMEDPDSNEALCGILDEVFDKYPIDRSRVYITGHSHNSSYAQKFMLRHSELFAGYAVLGGGLGLPAAKNKLAVFELSEDEVEKLRGMDMPLIIMAAQYEHNRPDVSANNRSPMPFDEWASAIQRRMKAFNCRIPSVEEIADAVNSPDKATRILGIPNDKNEVVYIDGFEHYVMDFKNKDGRYHLRLVAVENMPHMPLPSMPLMCWSFLRRFKRDYITGKIIEI